MEGSCFLISFRFDLSCSFRIDLTNSLDAPVLILFKITSTSLKKGAVVVLIFLKIVTVYDIKMLVLCWFYYCIALH